MFFFVLCFYLVFFYLLFFICFLLEHGMNEDGSFIGQYGRKGKPEANNAAFATLV